MFSNYKKGLTLLAAGILASTQACQKEEEVHPEAGLQLSGNAEKLYNEVNLTYTASENSKIEKVDFYLNEQLLGEDTEKPYELLWNTKEVEDGSYTLKAVAQEKTGSTKEAVQQVEVKNTLLLLNVEDNFLYNQQNTKVERQQWIFLTDKEGKVIGEPQQLVNSHSLNWQRPSVFYSDSLCLNRLTYTSYFDEYNSRPNKHFKLYTYIDFSLDEATLKTPYHPEEIAGQIQMGIENDFDGTKEYRYSTTLPGHGSTRTSAGKKVEFTMFLEGANTQKGISIFEPNEEGGDNMKRFFRWDELTAGNTYLLHTRDYTPMLEKTVSISFDFSHITFFLDGYFGPEEPYEKGYMYSETYASEGRGIKLYYIDDFPINFTYISGRTAEGKRFSFYLKDKIPEVLSITHFSNSITEDSYKSFQVNSDGLYDTGKGVWGYKKDDESVYLSIYKEVFFSSEADATYAKPEIPRTLLEMYPELSAETELYHSYALNNHKLSSYDEMMQYWFSDSFSGKEYWEYSAFYSYPGSNGGRLLPQQDGAQTRQEARDENLQVRGFFSY